jgi:pimeloyl-ACP methyl ester carboxylesterase
VNPVFFGRAPKSLFGVHRAPAGRSARATGIVLCYPFGQEYMRAHRAFRQLAMLLSRSGFHTLSFDYFGTGDSSGDAREATLSQWIEDAQAAADELRDTAELQRIAFVGLRLGASIAALAAAGRSDVEHVVMWDPAVRGPDYLREILEDYVPNADDEAHPGDGTIGVRGFPLTAALQAEIAKLDLLAAGVPVGPSRRVVIASEARSEYESIGRHAVGEMTADYQIVRVEGNWNEVDDYGGALIPVALIQQIVAYLAKEAA